MKLWFKKSEKTNYNCGHENKQQTSAAAAAIVKLVKQSEIKAETEERISKENFMFFQGPFQTCALNLCA